MTRQTAAEAAACRSLKDVPNYHEATSPDLVVVNRAAAPDELRRLLEDCSAVLSADELQHLAYLAREREARQVDRLIELGDRKTIGAVLRGES